MEEQLKNIIADICDGDLGKAEAGSDRHNLQRQKNLNRLLILIQQLPGIYQSSHQDYPEAYNKTLEWICKNIDRFSPQAESIEKSLTIWINGYLKWRIRDLYISDNSYDPRRVYATNKIEDMRIDLIESIPDPQVTLSLLDTKIAEMQAKQEERLGQIIVDYIKLDKGENLKNNHPRKHPQCNCHCLAIKLLLEQPPQKISKIARELKVNNQTIYSHWKKKCLPLLQEIGAKLEK